MQRVVLECRDMSVPEIGAAIFKFYNGLDDGGSFDVVLGAYSPGLRMWLIEGGAKHEAAQQDDGAWLLTITRGLSPGQGTIPGLHHVTTAPSGKVWTCERAQRLVCIDGASGEVLKTGTIATKASHLAIAADEKWVFVADPGANTLVAVDANDMSVKHKWSAPGGPQLPLVTDDGIVCVTGAGSGTLTIVRPKGDDFDEQTIEVGSCPHDPVTSQDGKYIFVPCAGDGLVVKVRLTDGEIIGRYVAGDGAAHLALHPDGTRLYSANTFDGTVSCLSVEGDMLAQAQSGHWAHQPEITPDGRFVYVANFLDDTLGVFDADSLEKKAQLPTEVYPHGLDVSPDGTRVIATGFGSDYVRIYDGVAHEQIARVKVGRGSSHSAFLKDSNIAYVGCSVDDHLAQIDLMRDECIGNIAV